MHASMLGLANRGICMCGVRHNMVVNTRSGGQCPLSVSLHEQDVLPSAGKVFACD